jgi:hypothetical protein
MSAPASRSRKTSSSGADQPSAGGHGVWKLALWNGSAWFGPWFYRRLRWPTAVKRTRLDDLKPHLPADAWEAFLLAIRHHLERQVPLDLDVRVQRGDGRLEWWRIQGSVERNPAGQPMQLVGTTREVSAEHPDPSTESQP